MTRSARSFASRCVCSLLPFSRSCSERKTIKTPYAYFEVMHVDSPLVPWDKSCRPNKRWTILHLMQGDAVSEKLIKQFSCIAEMRSRRLLVADVVCFFLQWTNADDALPQDKLDALQVSCPNS